MRRSMCGAWPATHNSRSPFAADFGPYRAARAGAMRDPVRHAAQRHHDAMRKRRRLRQPAEPRRDPAAMLLREGARLLQRAARRHRQDDFAGRRLDAQRIAPRLPVPPQPHRIDRSCRKRLRSSAARSGDDRAAHAAAWRNTPNPIAGGDNATSPAADGEICVTRRFDRLCGMHVRRRCRNARVPLRAAGRLAHRQHEIGNARRDLRAEARAVEHAVMSDARLQPMRLAVRRDVGAQAVRRLGLADTGNIVVFAFDGEQARRA